MSGAIKLKLASWNLPPLESGPGLVTEGRKQQQQQLQDREAPKLAHPDDGPFGDLAVNQSRYKTKRVWTEISQLNASKAGTDVWIRGRVHSKLTKGSMAFLLIRTGFSSVQILIHQQITTKDMVKFAGKIPNESIIDVYGEVKETKVDKPTQKDVEIQVKKIYVISSSEPILPFQLDDASSREEKGGPPAEAESNQKKGKKDKEEKKVLTVGQENRLNNRWIDLRTPANHAIFRLQAAVQKYFREYFDALGFIEIHTPKITPGVSEGGAQVFRTNYFGRTACLAQSPQLYKQMAVVSDLYRVYEIGPVFRAEDSNTHRHMCEFMGLDFEMAFKEHYHEVLTTVANLFIYVFEQIAKHHQLELAAVNAQYPFEPLLVPKETVVLDFKEAIQLLKDAGEKTEGNDFSTANEKALGKIVHDKYKSDLFIVDKWPLGARPFYTMPDPDCPGYTNSYDVFLRGEEITSGAQRIHEPELLKKRAQECEIPLSSIQKYVDSFKYGAFPHGGGGIGLERVVMLMLGLDNIRKSSLFPRDPKRLEP